MKLYRNLLILLSLSSFLWAQGTESRSPNSASSPVVVKTQETKKPSSSKKRDHFRFSLMTGVRYQSNPFTLGKADLDTFATAPSYKNVGMEESYEILIPLSGRLTVDAKKFHAEGAFAFEIPTINSSLFMGSGEFVLGYHTKKFALDGSYEFTPSNPVRPTFIDDWQKFPELTSSTNYAMMDFKSNKMALKGTFKKPKVDPALEISYAINNYEPYFDPYDHSILSLTYGMGQKKKKVDWDMELGYGQIFAETYVDPLPSPRPITPSGYQFKLGGSFSVPVGVTELGLSTYAISRTFSTDDPNDSYYQRYDLFGAVTPFVSIRLGEKPFSLRLACADKYRYTSMPDPSREEAKRYNSVEPGITLRWSPTW